ncbi:hypothetical protein [Metabacillus fastidiosus]|uniref:hypothetical protein n=1 Tax=Metabacillus fastidiosus TaxID=1458 RepID=UPI003D2ADF1B
MSNQEELKLKEKELEIEILKTDKKILELMKEEKLIQLRDNLERARLIGMFLSEIVDKKTISTKLAWDIIGNNKEFLSVFNIKGKNAIINQEKFSELESEYFELEKVLDKEKEYLDQI